MTISREIRESLFSTLSPLPYIIILLIILPISASTSPILFLFIFSLTISSIYLMVVRSVKSIRSSISEREENLPSPTDEYKGKTFSERFLNISREALFTVDSGVAPIREYSNRPLFRYGVYSFWGFVFSVAAFLLSATLLGWLVSSGTLDSMADSPVSASFQNAPLGMVDFLLAIVPVFNGLDFKNQVFIGGVIFSTGVFFLTAARNLSEISDDVHKRILRVIVGWNPLFKNELLNSLPIVGLYMIILHFT